MVITCENNGFITRGLWPLMINPLFSVVMTITARDIFPLFSPAIYQSRILLPCNIRVTSFYSLTLRLFEEPQEVKRIFALQMSFYYSKKQIFIQTIATT